MTDWGSGAREIAQTYLGARCVHIIIPVECLTLMEGINDEIGCKNRRPYGAAAKRPVGSWRARGRAACDRGHTVRRAAL